MRIISGTYKGRRITAPKKLPVRPTTDMAKEALFNILNNRYYFEGLTVLDLFAGTGNISYEFASRGAGPITAVDADYNCVKFIGKTTEELGFPISATRADVYQYLERITTTYDVIFADPPYNMPEEDFGKIAEIIFRKNLLKEEGVLVIEHGKETDLSAIDHFDESRRYGGSVFSFFRAEDE
ncbi:RsmD family RNA methyltransferase [Zeaxanthinibacter sp. PT1]|uniref:RsmD family RNA methyltransferase n=1 Tax=Zeaxanthinibacter TaxID=561554 RepID=UPI00234ADE81|nr:RsmD family RNA methyltransferase [Zeaxanthinibacter sp. PT1]MDC6352059.1 RsmD family RNA methyltransferase [Zeaxanthinibacter sp. PT1]